METNKTCPSCGKPIGPDAPQGLCPACLLKVGAGSYSMPAGGPTVQGHEFEPPSVADLAGLFPQLEILELIGRGGMGAVYKARQKDLDRVVALKILASRAGADPGFAERFTREARALARLSHPNVVAVYDFGQVQDLHYFVMEYVDGTNLRQVERSGGLSPKQALAIIPQICEALQFAHDKGVVHRDIKPENILLDREGHVKIADFGLAKILGQRQDLTLTQEGHVMGTPLYMAPEQVEHPQSVDHRADIYSLGVVFYEMLTGELPMGKFQPPSAKVQIDVRLDEVVLRALAKEPDRRYQKASQVKTEVESIASSLEAGQQTDAAPVPRFDEALDLERIRPLVLALAVAFCLAGLAKWIRSPSTANAIRLAVCITAISVVAWRPAMRVVLKPLELLYLIGCAILCQDAAGRGKGPKWRTNLRWTGRILGLLAFLFVLIFILAEGFPRFLGQPLTVQLELAATAEMLIGLLLGWRWAGWGAFLIADGWLVFLFAEGGLPPIPYTAFLVVAGLYAWSWWTQQGGPRPAPAGDQAAIKEAEWRDARNWTGPKWLSVYYSKRDSRVWVPKQIPLLGWTVNLGHPKGLAVLLGLILFLSLLPAIVAYLSPSQGHHARSDSPDTPGFGPVEEAVFADKAGVRAFGLDLETRRLLDVPSDFVEPGRPVEIVRIQEWLRVHGIDLVNREGRDGLTLVDGVAIVAASSGVDRFDTLSADYVRQSADYLASVTGSGPAGSPLICSIHTTAEGSTWIFRTREGSAGVLQISGLPDGPRGVKIHYKLVQGADAASPPLPSAAATVPAGETFRPEIERVVHDLDEQQGNEALSLTTGKQFSLPQEFESWSREQRSQWISDNGIDLFADYARNRWAIMTLDLMLADLSQSQWDEVTRDQVQNALSAADSGIETLERGGFRFYLLSEGAKPPLSYAFSTAKGSQGVLQIIGSTESPRSLKIRYKLIQHASATGRTP